MLRPSYIEIVNEFLLVHEEFISILVVSHLDLQIKDEHKFLLISVTFQPLYLLIP